MAEERVTDEPIERRQARNWALGCTLMALAAIGALVFLTSDLMDRFFGGGPDPETIATASLEGLREQNVLVPFAARFVAVTTSSQSRFGLTARKTLIMPGDVRYELDLGALGEDDVEWDEAARTLTVTLPDVSVAGPEIDMSQIREYDEGGLLMALSDAEESLDQANRVAARESLLEQARGETVMRLAREAARTAVERNFELPLRAAEVDADVVVRFEHEGRRNANQMDRSRNILRERRQEQAQ